MKKMISEREGEGTFHAEVQHAQAQEQGTGMYGLEEGSWQKTQVEQKVGTSLGRARIPC